MFQKLDIAINLSIGYYTKCRKQYIAISQAGGRSMCYMLNIPKKRSGKITQFKHYQTDAPV